MIKEFIFEDKSAFLHELESLVKSGTNIDHINLITPFPVHEADHIIHETPSKLKWFTLFGALSGFVIGALFTTYTVLEWPIQLGSKPIVTIPPFIVIAYALTILLGGLMSFAGFIILAWLPSLKGMTSTKEYGNHFVIQVNDEEKL